VGLTHGRVTMELALVAAVEGNPSVSEDESVLADARAGLVMQSRALERVAGALDAAFVCAVDLLLRCEGRIIVCGIGKSGAVARKISSTLACSGTPSHFLHAAEASHGDLGMVTSTDVVVLVSKSGETAEVIRLLPEFQSLGVAVIAITGNPQSTLAQGAAVVLDASVDQESCPHGTVPTTSTLVAQALGDALAMAALKRRNLSRADLVNLHPSVKRDELATER